MKSILVVSGDPETSDSIRKSIKFEYDVKRVGSKNEALSLTTKTRCDYIFIDIDLLSENKKNEIKNALQQFWGIDPTIEIVVMAPQDRIRDAVAAVKMGASDYLTYPIDSEEIGLLIDDIYEQSIILSEID